MQLQTKGFGVMHCPGRVLLALMCLVFVTVDVQGVAAMDRFVPIEGMVVSTAALPCEAESLAVGRFVSEVRRMTGQSLPVVWGRLSNGGARIVAGNRASL